jgi:hypothetical protein
VYFRQAAKNTNLVFDNENLISAAGVEPAMRLADAAGLAELTAAHVRLAGPQAADTPLKVGCLVTGMLMGADSIDDMNLLRDCGLQHVFTEVRAPSTLGSFLRSFDHGTVRQLQAVHRRLLPGLARRAPLLPGKDILAYLDVDACQRRVYGHKKQGAAFGPARVGSKVVTVRGLNVLAAGISTRTATTPLITGTRLRGGSASDTRGAASFITEQINVAAEAGVTGDLLARADSSYYNGPVISAIDRVGAFFSVTMRSDPKNRRAIAAIPAEAWVAIRYPNAVYDDQLQMWYSDAEVAEVHPAVPPGRVLPRQPQYKVADLLAGRRAARPSRVGPLASGQTAVPGQQGSRGNPQSGGQQPAQGRHDRAVGPVRPGTGDLAAQHHDLGDAAP